MFPRLRAAACTVFFVSVVTAPAQTIHVPADRPTIQAAIDAADDGETVLVSPGTYFENIDFKGKVITVTSTGGAAATIIDGRGQGPAVSFEETGSHADSNQLHATLNGFTVQNGGVEPSSNPTGGIYLHMYSPTITNNIITGSHCAGIWVDSATPLIQNNEIDRTQANSQPGDCPVNGGGSAIVVSGQTNSVGGIGGAALILGNTIQQNSQGGQDGPGAGGITALNGPVVIENNIFHTNTTSGNGGAIYVATTNILIVQNLIYDNVAGCGGGAIASDRVFPNVSVSGTLVIASNTIASNSVNPVGCNNIANFIDAPHTDEILIADSGSNLFSTLMTNNIVFGSTATESVTCGSPVGQANIPIFDHNLFFNASGPSFAANCQDPTGSYGNQNADPQFVNAVDGNFMVRATSPAIDAGNTSALTLENNSSLGGINTATDFAGNPRVADATSKGYSVLDIGAYEYVGAAAPTTTTVTLEPTGSAHYSSVYSATGGNSVGFAATVTSPMANSGTGCLGPVVFAEDGAMIGTVHLVAYTATATLKNVILVPGMHRFTASYAGQSPCSSGVAVEILYVVSNYAPSLSLTSSINPVLEGQPVTFTVNITDAGSTQSLPIVLADGAITLATLTPDTNGIAIYTTSALSVGDHQITASYAGDATHNAAQAHIIESVVTPVPQIITFPALATPAFAGTSIALAATSTSGLPVTYTVVSGPGTVSGTTLTYTGKGTVIVEADQPGNGTYFPAPFMQRAVVVTALTEPVGTTSPALTTTVTFSSSGALRSIGVLTQGAVNLDFKFVPGGTCAIGTTYVVGQTCTVEFNLTPAVPGIRYGGITLMSSLGGLLANSYIYGMGIGPQVNYTPGVQSVLASGLTKPVGLAFDGNGNLFVADANSGQVKEIFAASGYTSIHAVGSGFTSPVGVAVDGNGNLFIAENNTASDVKEVLAAGGYTTVVTLGSGFNQPAEVAVDGNGNVFVADMANNAIKEIPVATGYNTVLTLPGTYNGPDGIAVDSNGNLFVADTGTSHVKELLAADGYTTVSTLTGSFPFVTALVVSASGNIFVTNAGDNSLKEIFAAGGYTTVETLSTGLDGLTGIALDGSGNVFYSSTVNGTISKLDYVDPPSLTFATTPVGSTSADSPQTVTMINNGNADLTFSVPGGPNNPSITPGFTVGNSSTCPQLNTSSAAATLPIGKSCTDVISFTPIAGGLDSGKLITTDNNLNVAGATQIVPLNGTGTTVPTTITFTVPNHTYGDPPFTVSAMSNSPSPFTYSVVSGPATISGATVTLTGAGIVVLRATQNASGPYTAASQTASFIVVKEAQTISFAAPASPVTFGIGPVALSATTNSGLPVTFTVLSGPATVNGNMLSYTGAGIVVVAADQAGNANYGPASEVTHTVIVNVQVAAIQLNATPNPVFLKNPVSLTATITATGGMPTGTVTFLDGSNPIGNAIVSRTAATASISTLALGTHNITAIYSGDNNFVSIASGVVIVTVQDFALAINNPDVTIIHGGTATYSLVLSSVGGVGMASTVDIAVSGAPMGSEINFTPQSVPTGSGATLVTLVIHTPNYPSGPWNASKAESASKVTLAFLVLGALLLPFRRSRVIRSALMRRMSSLILLFAGAIAAAALTGCGSGWKTQQWKINVTASSGALSRTATATLTSECKDGRSACPIE